MFNKEKKPGLRIKRRHAGDAITEGEGKCMAVRVHWCLAKQDQLHNFKHTFVWMGRFEDREVVTC